MQRLSAVLLVATLLNFTVTAAVASGFALRESSAGAMGTAYASAAASNNDSSFLFYNPASLGGVEDWDASINATALLLDSNGRFAATTTVGTPAGGSATPQGFIGDALVPGFSLRYRMNDRLAIGVSLSTPWGESTSYPATWTGRYYTIGTNLVAYNASPVVSFQLTPQLTVAVGAQIQYVRSHLTEAIDFGTLGAVNHVPGSVPGTQDGFVHLHGHGWGAGYVLGVRWQPTSDLAIGVAYRSEVQQVLKGSERFIYDRAGIAVTINALTGAFANSGGRADLPTPAVLAVGTRWRIDDRWSALGEVEYTNWSSLKQLSLQANDPFNPVSVTTLNWKNTWFTSLGAEYRIDDRWTLRAGIAFDEAAAPRLTLEPRIPDADRYWIAAGAGYHWSGNIDVNFALSHLFAPQSTINQTVFQPGNLGRGNLGGTSSSNATLIAAQISIHWVRPRMDKSVASVDSEPVQRNTLPISVW